MVEAAPHIRTTTRETSNSPIVSRVVADIDLTAKSPYGVVHPKERRAATTRKVS